MTRIEDMTEPQRQSWIVVLADGAVFAYFLQKMLYNGGIVKYSGGDLMAIFIGVIIVTIIAHAVIAATFDLRKKKQKFQSDERDLEIARRGDHFGFMFLRTAVGIILFILLFEYTFPGEYTPPISVLEPPLMFFWLMCASYVGDLIKHVSIVLSYRNG